MPEKPELLKMKDVTAALNVSRQTIYNMAKRGQLNLVWLGRTYRVRRAEVERILEEGAKKRVK